MLKKFSNNIFDYFYHENFSKVAEQEEKILFQLPNQRRKLPEVGDMCSASLLASGGHAAVLQHRLGSSLLQHSPFFVFLNFYFF